VDPDHFDEDPDPTFFLTNIVNISFGSESGKQINYGAIQAGPGSYLDIFVAIGRKYVVK
jgi:hypothetical protein